MSDALGQTQVGLGPAEWPATCANAFLGRYRVTGILGWSTLTDTALILEPGTPLPTGTGPEEQPGAIAGLGS